MKNISVKRNCIKKWYQCIYNDELLINEDFNIRIYPGQIVKIQRNDTTNNWPIVFIDNENYDMAIEDNEFSEYFEEFDIDTFEKKMSRKDFKQIFECDEDTMQKIDEVLCMGFYEDGYYQVAVDRMLESALDARGHYLSKGLNVEHEIVYYMMLHNKYSGEYTIDDWLKDTLENYPEYLDEDFSYIENIDEYFDVCIKN